jgi:hypothetical protein
MLRTRSVSFKFNACLKVRENVGNVETTVQGRGANHKMDPCATRVRTENGILIPRNARVVMQLTWISFAWMTGPLSTRELEERRLGKKVTSWEGDVLSYDSILCQLFEL